MVLRDELNRYLAELYGFGDFEDYCLNGLQVEGKEQIEKIAFVTVLTRNSAHLVICLQRLGNSVGQLVKRIDDPPAGTIAQMLQTAKI